MKLESPYLRWLLRREDLTGKGFHHDLFVAAMLLPEEGWSDEEAFQILRRAADMSGRNRALFRLCLLGIYLELEEWEPEPEAARKVQALLERL
jgi:hypothetical protein